MNKNTEHYLITALWSSVDDNGEPLDSKYSLSDLSEETKTRAAKDVDDFLEQAGALTDDYSNSKVMHDFWLTRNRHGAGFWDGDYSKIDGEELTKLSHAFGEINLYIGDDNKLYFDRTEK